MKLNILPLTLLFTSLSSSVFAGEATTIPVSIDMDNKLAQGNMASARISNNPFENIGCGTSSIVYQSDLKTEVVSYGFCQARIGEGEDNGAFIFCNTDNPEIIKSMRALNDYSYIRFRWNDNQECTSVYSSTQSFYIPNFILKRVRTNSHTQK
ncbi:hypothetical protein [uncultured Shewanella sp.]|uniref:hypothetical protein n=1 Tax=uncultured Shewanella sp. TaxID=173975 RepID=UPI0026399138|nr:hypothetical protein [uncultured Shewanella sp.]